MRVRIFIATTEGPVSVDGINPCPLGKSIVCVSGNKEPLRGFSAMYNEFVRKRLVQATPKQPAAFRLDISSRIDTGESWQLGVFLAHALRNSDRLAGPAQEQEAASFVLATGEIEYGLSVGTVGYVEEKLRASRGLIEAALNVGQRVILCLPEGNAGDGKSEQDKARKAGAEILCAASVYELFTRLELARPNWQPSDEEPWEGSPFRGLAVFEPHHRRIYFGRGKAREEALRQLRRQSQDGCAFLLIHGSSGTGKSSLARAGLLGDIAYMSTRTEPWLTAVLVPGRDERLPTLALAETLIRLLPGIGMDAKDVASIIVTAPQDACALIAKALDGATPGAQTRLALLIDQLEELLLWARDMRVPDADAQREAFAEMLGHLARSGSVWVIATLRSDLLTMLDDSPALSQLSVSNRLYRLERPGRAALHEIVKRPAQLAGFQFVGRDREGLHFSDVLVEAGVAAPDSLPLLQFVLERLFEREGGTGVISFESYMRIGTLTNAIGEWAEATVNELDSSPEAARAVDDLILELGRPDAETGTIVARTAVLDSEFLTPERERAVEALTRARLLVLDAAGSHRTARVAHEALLSHWPRSQRLFASRKLALELRERLQREAEDWVAEGRDASLLIRPGTRLAAAEQLVGEGTLHISESVRFYVTASVERDRHDTAEEQRRQEARMAEQRRRGERERLRLATDQQKIESHLRAREYPQAAKVLGEVVSALAHPDSELAEERQRFAALHERIDCLAQLFQGMRETFALAGEEDFRAAHVACERALGALDVLDDARWWERLPSDHLDADHIAHIRQEVYRLLLIYSGLQLVPAIQSLLAVRPGVGPSPARGFNPAELVRYLPQFILTAIVSAGGIGPIRLPRRQDKPDTLEEVAKSTEALLRARQLEEAAQTGSRARASRTSYVVGQIVAMLTELASAPKGGPIDYRTWLGRRGPKRPPEPVNATDYFYVGLFNYFVAMRRDALFAKVLRLLEGRFPDLDGRYPFATAERLLRASIALEPQNYWPHWVLGRTLLGSGDPRGAELAFNAAIAVQPNYARGYEQRALALARQWARTREPSLRARAEMDSAMALERAEGDPSVYWPRGELLELLGRTRDALHAYARWLELEENVLNKISRGSGIVHLGELAGRLACGAAGRDDEALRADAHALLALVQMTWGEEDQALAHAKSGLAIDPCHGHALTVEGVVHLRRNDPRRAIQSLERAMDSDPHNHLASLSYARACESLGDREAALAAWRALGAVGAPAQPERCPPWMAREAVMSEARLSQFSEAAASQSGTRP